MYIESEFVMQLFFTNSLYRILAMTILTRRKNITVSAVALRWIRVLSLSSGRERRSCDRGRCAGKILCGLVQVLISGRVTFS